MKGNTCNFETWGECDACGKTGWLHQCWASGVETWACNECRGETGDPYDEEGTT